MKLALRLSIVFGAALACAACSTTPPPVSAHNLERPSDLAFACVGLFTPPDGGAITDAGAPVVNVVSGRPMYECNNPGSFDPPFDITRRTFGFVANSARGELSVIDLNNSKLVDLDLVNPETNVAPLGVLPEQLSASSDGCRIVSANRGSCDLTMVDIGTLMTPELGAEAKLPTSTIGSSTQPATGPSTVAQQIVVRRVRNNVPAEPLRLNPQEVMFLPQDTSAISGTSNLCTRDGPHADPIGWNATPSMPVETQWKALVTYPTCNLVALVDLPSGNIVDSVKVNAGSDGVSIAFQSIGLRSRLPGRRFLRRSRRARRRRSRRWHRRQRGRRVGQRRSSAATAVSTDPFVNPTGTRPSSLAIVPTGERAYVGLTQASFVAALDVQRNHLAIPSTGGSIKLHESALGVNAVRLSVDPFQPRPQLAAGPARGLRGQRYPRHPPVPVRHRARRDGPRRRRQPAQPAVAGDRVRRQRRSAVRAGALGRPAGAGSHQHLLADGATRPGAPAAAGAGAGHHAAVDPARRRLRPDRDRQCRRGGARWSLRLHPDDQWSGLRGQHRSDAAHAAGGERWHDPIAAAGGSAAGQHAP